MNLPDRSQLLAFGRHIPTFAAGVVFSATTIGIMTSQDAATANTAFGQISHGVAEIIAGFSALVPVAMGMIAAVKANPVAQMIMGAFAIVHKNASVADVPGTDQAMIMEATAKLPKAEIVVTNDPRVAAATGPAVVLNNDLKTTLKVSQ